MNINESEKLIPKEIIQKFKNTMNLDNLPADLHISTITVTCKFDTCFNVQNIGKYIDLTTDGIVSAKYGSGENYLRSLIPIKKKKKKKPKKIFYNQTTVEILSKLFKNKINVKLFKNGSIQMTGCKGLENFLEVLMVLCRELKKNKAIINPNTMNDVILKPFLTTPENLGVEKIKSIKVRMINSGLKTGFEIDREKLYNILLRKGVHCTFEPCAHAGVNIKYNYKGQDTISIFIFESGAIIITGAKNIDHIMHSYNFVTKILYENYHDIVLSIISIEYLLSKFKSDKYF